MGKKKRTRSAPRAEPMKRSISFVTDKMWEDVLESGGYVSLSHNPEICAAVDTIARLISSMTIHLMENTEDGDVRIRNELSRKIDIDPNKNMTRASFVHWIVKTMFLEGDGNAVVYPLTKSGLLDDLQPIPPHMVSFIPDGWGYKVNIGGEQYDPSNVLHFVLNPSSNYPWRGEGYRVALADVANNLKQAAATEKGFMSSKWKPSIIVKVDGLTDEFASKSGRKKLLESYIEAGAAGEPWMIPSEQFSVETVRPLSLADLALADHVQLDKKTVASILGIPAFVLGVGEFKSQEWNNFINSVIMTRAKGIEQEMTKKLLVSPAWFFRFNARSLYSYDLKDLNEIACNQYVRGIMDGNEVRDWTGQAPREGLNELIILENYIPRGMIGDQKKLNGSGGGEG